MNCAGVSKIGLVRKINEDRFYIGEHVYIVADGMGGYQGGDIASTIAVDDVVSSLQHVKYVNEDILYQAIVRANNTIWDKVQKELPLKGMGTTLIVSVIDKHTLYWGNVGDSRLYLYRKGHLSQISKDHSLVQTLVDSGELTADERITYPKKNYLTRAVGVEPQICVDTGRIEVMSGDKILLCSDGLSGYMADEEIEKVFSTQNENSNIVDALIKHIYDLGAKDNVTVIVDTVE